MTLPHINIKTTHVDVDRHTEHFVDEKVRMLEKFIPKDETALMCDVELEKDLKHHTGKIYRAEINLKVGGTLFRAEASGETIEDALLEARDEVKKELRRTMSRKQSLVRRGGQRVKDMMRFGR